MTVLKPNQDTQWHNFWLLYIWIKIPRNINTFQTILKLTNIVM
jgi:hypothetical protein